MASPTKNIVFALLHESGHLNPSFKLAKALARRGNRVRYLAIPEAQPIIEAQGIEVIPLLPELFPRGFTDEEQKFGTLARRRSITRRFQALLDRLERAGAELLPERPDLMLIDVTQPQLAFWAHKNGVRFAYLNTSLPQTRDFGVPPLRSGRSYGPSPSERLQAELDWQRFLLKRRLSASVAQLGGMCPPYEISRKSAERFGIRASALDWRTAYMPQLKGVPEFGLCPSAFDFPRKTQAHRSELASVDLTRKEQGFDWGKIPAHKPLLYCALGGQRYRPEDVPGFFARLVRVMESQPGWHLILSRGKHVSAEFLGSLPSNITLVESAPQLTILGRARVMITHAGLGSTKECILLGVPMLAIPLDVDQPANAARIAYHGLGLVGDVRHSSEDELSTQLATLLRDQEIRQRVANMREKFLRVEESERGVDRVEELAR